MRSEKIIALALLGLIIAKIIDFKENIHFVKLDDEYPKQSPNSYWNLQSITASGTASINTVSPSFENSELVYEGG